jgi:hypothetical protein
MLSVIILTVAFFGSAERYFAERHHVECRGAK